MSTRGMLEVFETFGTPYILYPSVMFSFVYHLLLCYAIFQAFAAMWLRASLFSFVCPA
jgi:hypothetical protein